MKLSEIKSGALDERFNVALEEVLENIADPNTPRDKVREITIKVRLATNDDRSQVVMDFDVSSKKPTYRPVTTFALIGREDGRMVAREATSKLGADARQGTLKSFPKTAE